MTQSVTFAVDEVVPARKRLPECGLAESLGSRLEEPMLATSHAEARFVPPLDTHPLVAAVHLAFSEHRPLVLSPDILWVTIAQGLALHIVHNAEALRSDLVRHQGRKELVIQRASWDTTSAEFWNGVVSDFSARLSEESPALHDLMVCDFSTTGPVERVVSQVVLMEALREYFDYVIRCVCGIPTITLEGSPEDWSRLRQKVEQLSHYGLDWWAQHLLPICDQFVRASQGLEDGGFWRSIYKLRKAYGVETINGWICKLFPFIRNHATGDYDVKNPVFDAPPEFGGDNPRAPGWIPSSVLPTGLSRAPLTLLVELPDGRKSESLAITAGFLGVSQHWKKALRPELGWVVHEARGLEALLRRVMNEHRAEPPLPEERLRSWKRTKESFGLPAEILRLYSTCNGASLFGEPDRPTYRIRAAWQLKGWRPTPPPTRPGGARVLVRPTPPPAPPSSGGPRIWVQRVSSFTWVQFCDLADGSFLAYKLEVAPRRPIVWVKDPQDDHGLCVAENLEEFLRLALDSKGHLYFQEPGFTPGERITF